MTSILDSQAVFATIRFGNFKDRDIRVDIVQLPIEVLLALNSSVAVLMLHGEVARLLSLRTKHLHGLLV